MSKSSIETPNSNNFIEKRFVNNINNKWNGHHHYVCVEREMLHRLTGLAVYLIFDRNRCTTDRGCDPAHLISRYSH